MHELKHLFVLGSSQATRLFNGRIPLSIQRPGRREVYAHCLTELLLLGSSFKQFVWMWLFPSQSETTKVVLVTIRLLNQHQLKLSRLSFQTTKCHPEPKCVILSAAKDLAPASAFPCYIPHLSSCYSTCHPEHSEGSHPYPRLISRYPDKKPTSKRCAIKHESCILPICQTDEVPITSWRVTG